MLIVVQIGFKLVVYNVFRFTNKIPIHSKVFTLYMNVIKVQVQSENFYGSLSENLVKKVDSADFLIM